MRLKKLTHLTDMQPIDRAFNPEVRLAELAELSESPLIGAQIERSRSAIERATLASGRAPGLFIDEDDHLEARWEIVSPPDTAARIVNVTFGSAIEIYVFDRATDEMTKEITLGVDEPAAGDRIAGVIEATIGGDCSAVIET